MIYPNLNIKSTAHAQIPTHSTPSFSSSFIHPRISNNDDVNNNNNNNTNKTHVLIPNSSSINAKKDNQPTVLGSVIVSNLKKSQAFVNLSHPKLLSPPLEKNPKNITMLKEQVLLSK